jgi:hypothetical protein
MRGPRSGSPVREDVDTWGTSQRSTPGIEDEGLATPPSTSVDGTAGMAVCSLCGHQIAPPRGQTKNSADRLLNQNS